MMKVYREYHYSMKEQRTLRQNGYAEITYTDHYVDEFGEYNTITGTEDFSIERWKNVARRMVYTPTGESNKGGKRRWEYFGAVYARTATDCGKIARLVLAGREISVRQY